MKLETLLNCSRKMFHLMNEFESFKYSARGTVFLARFRNKLFAVTAAHVIKDFNDDSARIMIHPKARGIFWHTMDC